VNRDCNGDVFERWGKTWGRCFWDGALFDFTPPLEACPNCHRKWEPVSAETSRSQWNPDTSPDVALHIDVPHYKAAEAYLGKHDE
jgi:hypothetical protein